MPRTRRKPEALALVQEQIGRMQVALAELQREIARLGRLRVREASPAPTSLREVRQAAEREFLVEVGEEHEWNRTRMARSLRIDRKVLYRKMKSLGLLAAHPTPYSQRARPAAVRTGPAKPRRRR